jgi:hypothetical protein
MQDHKKKIVVQGQPGQKTPKNNNNKNQPKTKLSPYLKWQVEDLPNKSSALSSNPNISLPPI